MLTSRGKSIDALLCLLQSVQVVGMRYPTTAGLNNAQTARIWPAQPSFPSTLRPIPAKELLDRGPRAFSLRRHLFEMPGPPCSSLHAVLPEASMPVFKAETMTSRCRAVKPAFQNVRSGPTAGRLLLWSTSRCSVPVSFFDLHQQRTSSRLPSHSAHSASCP